MTQPERWSAGSAVLVQDILKLPIFPFMHAAVVKFVARCILRSKAFDARSASLTTAPAACARSVVLLLFFVLPWASASAQSTALSASISQIMQAESAQPAFWGAYVEDVQSGQVHYALNARHPFIPASNQKLLTSAAALDALGSQYRYKTVLYFDGSVSGDVLRGDLILKGSGDPTFGSVQASGEDPLRLWARRLAELGVRRIEGRIVGDDNVFDDRAYAKGWDIDYITDQASRALGVSASGLAYNDNVVEVKITANGTNRAPEITTRPDGIVQIRNDLMTAGRRRGISVRTSRDFGSETVRLEGSIPRAYDGTIVTPVTNPTAFTANALALHLQQYGIEVDAEIADIDDLNEFEYETDRPLFVYVSPPLSEILTIVNKRSNNFYAEQVFRTFSWGGSADGGEKRIKELLSRAGASTTGVAIRDGSGLSRKDMMTPEALGKLLVHMYGHQERDVFLASIPQGGEPRSTLRYRLHNQPVQAKTGSLEYVRTLSGYARTPTGRTLAFVVFANNYTGPSYQITQTIDRIVMELASSGASS